MPSPFLHGAPPLVRMADGTIKQVNPLTGTQVWTVPGRAGRKKAAESGCALCPERYLDTPPEKARLVLTEPAVGGGGPTGASGSPTAGHVPSAGSLPHAELADGPTPTGTTPAGVWRTLRGIPAEELFATQAEFRRIPNLFEIVSFDYWHRNYGYALPPAAAARMAAYLTTPAGREHTLAVARARLLAGGMSVEQWQAQPQEAKLAPALAFFGGCHELIVPRRHDLDEGHANLPGDDLLVSSGRLTPEEHFRFIAFTIDALRSIYEANRYAHYVAVFQNWRKAAGASFDHLHKQLVAIDERGIQVEQELHRLRANPNLYNDLAVNYAAYENLIIAENDHAVAFAGFGHRFPSLEVYSKSAASEPWEHTPEEIRGVADLLHACHAATGPDTPCNEEWHHRPMDVEVPMPWRIVLKWRVSTLAGFEGGTRIYINTIDPWTLRDQVVPRLFTLRNDELIADIRIATECACRPNSLLYNARR